MPCNTQLRPVSLTHRDQMIAKTFSASPEQVSAILNSDMGWSLEEIHSDYWRFYGEVQTVKSLIESNLDYTKSLVTIDADVDLYIEITEQAA